jgi:hypothetical protein
MAYMLQFVENRMQLGISMHEQETKDDLQGLIYTMYRLILIRYTSNQASCLLIRHISYALWESTAIIDLNTTWKRHNGYTLFRRVSDRGLKKQKNKLGDVVTVTLTLPALPCAPVAPERQLQIHAEEGGQLTRRRADGAGSSCSEWLRLGTI